MTTRRATILGVASVAAVAFGALIALTVDRSPTGWNLDRAGVFLLVAGVIGLTVLLFARRPNRAAAPVMMHATTSRAVEPSATVASIE